MEFVESKGSRVDIMHILHLLRLIGDELKNLIVKPTLQCLVLILFQWNPLPWIYEVKNSGSSSSKSLIVNSLWLYCLIVGSILCVMLIVWIYAYRWAWNMRKLSEITTKVADRCDYCWYEPLVLVEVGLTATFSKVKWSFSLFYSQEKDTIEGNGINLRFKSSSTVYFSSSFDDVVKFWKFSGMLRFFVAFRINEDTQWVLPRCLRCSETTVRNAFIVALMMSYWWTGNLEDKLLHGHIFNLENVAQCRNLTFLDDLRSCLMSL